ncbi:hypothetical protein K493DRAFT_286741, partial [Basidiobolus meristosporus CBS 931.73]
MSGKLSIKLNALADNTLMLIHERNRNKSLDLNYAKQEKTIKKNLERIKEGITELEEELSKEEESGASSRLLGQKEDQVIQLSQQYDKLEALLNGAQDENSRELLLGNSPPKSRKWETSVQIDAPEELENSQVLQLQERIMDEQDRNLDELSEAVGRQRELGLLISDELDRHIELLDETDEAIDSSQRKLTGARKRLDYVRRKTKEA